MYKKKFKTLLKYNLKAYKKIKKISVSNFYKSLKNVILELSNI